MKHFYKISAISFLFTFMVSGISFAQTTNSGQLYVSEDTQLSIVNAFRNGDSGSFLNDGEAFIYSHFANDGEVNFYQQTGLTRFLGADTQELSGIQDSYFYDVEFNNSSSEVPFHLSGAMIIEGESNFLSGIVDNDNHGGQMAFGEQGRHSHTSDASHVDGIVTHYGNEDFIYPIGDAGYYRYAGTSEVLASSAIIDSKYFLENSDELYPHNLRSDFVEIINTNEYWTIEHIGSSAETFISLSWSEETTPAEILEQPRDENLRIVRWDEGENRWIEEGGIVDNTNRTVSTVVDKYGVFTLARMEGTGELPCQINVYNAVTPNNDGVNDYFVIKDSNSCAENMEVEIYNRWGIKVFETDNYGEGRDVFDGFSRGRLNVNGDQQLPSGTYFYILKFDYETANQNRETFKKTGYLYLNGN